MIRSFKDPETEALAKGRRVARFAQIEAAARRKLRQLQIAEILEDLKEVSMDRLPPVTPGELLREEFLVPLGITKYRLAKEIGVPAQRVGDIVAGKRSITADTDLRLCRFFGLSKGYWLRAQVAYDTDIAEAVLATELEKITPWSEIAADKLRRSA